MSDEPIAVLVRYQVLAGREKRALEELTALVDTVTSREPDCLGITILQKSDDPTAILLVERWTNRETYIGPHLQQPHILDFMQRAREFVAGPPEITFWHSDKRS